MSKPTSKSMAKILDRYWEQEEAVEKDHQTALLKEMQTWASLTPKAIRVSRMSEDHIGKTINMIRRYRKISSKPWVRVLLAELDRRKKNS